MNDGLMVKELMPINVGGTDYKTLYRIASFSSLSRFIAVFIVSINKTQYTVPISYRVNLSYIPEYGMSRSLNTNGTYSIGETPFYYKKNENTIDLYMNTDTYCPMDIIPMSVTGGGLTFVESSEDISTLTRL